ncbi:MAG: pitrilysin family protein [Planctomycetota bacterium]
MPIEFKERRLPNGIRIAAEIDHDAATAAAGFFVKTGARDEAGALMGVSHYLEHMMFKGTDELSADQINQGFDDLGARNNAYTSGEMTCFYAHVLPEHIGEATDLLSKMMRPALRQDDFDTEKGVILEEIAMYKDNPFWVLYEQAMERHYAGHPLGHRVLGTDKTIEAMQRDAMLDYFGERYSADNTVVSLAGRLDFDAACDRIESLCGRWDATAPTRDNTPPRTSGDRFEIREDKVARAYLIWVAPAPSATDPRRFAAALASQALGAPDNSRLHWALIEPGIAEEAQSAFDAHDGCGELYCYASGEPARAGQIVETVEEEVAALASRVRKDDLDRLRSRAVTRATVSGERPGDRMQRLGRQLTLTGEYLPLERELEMLDSVTLDDVRAVLDEFPIAGATRGVLLPA